MSDLFFTKHYNTSFVNYIYSMSLRLLIYNLNEIQIDTSLLAEVKAHAPLLLSAPLARLASLAFYFESIRVSCP
jgi:hypothetical protein